MLGDLKRAQGYTLPAHFPAKKTAEVGLRYPGNDPKGNRTWGLRTRVKRANHSANKPQFKI